MDTTQIIYEELQTLEQDIVTRHEAARQVASGKTRDAFKVTADLTSGQLSGNSYVGVLERGRKPGKTPSDFVDILKRWAQAKGISFSDEKQFNLWANAIKWKIIKEGTKLYRSGQNQDIFETPLTQFGSRLSGRIATYYSDEIMNEIFNF